MAGDGRFTADRETAAETNDGEGAPVRVGRGEVVEERRGLTAELARVSARAEDGCSGGSTAAWSSPAVCGWRRCVLGSGSEEQAKGRKEWVAGVFVVLVRALEGVLGCCSGPSTAAARWRPRGGSGRRGEGKGHQREAKGGGEAPGRRVGASVKQNVGGLALHYAGGGALHSGGEKQRKQLEEGDKGRFEISKTSRDLNVKQG